MSEQNVKSSAAASALQASLESPAPDQNVYDEAVFLSGWVYAPGRDPASCRVRAYLDDCCIAETRMLFYRPDVSEKLGLSRGVLTGLVNRTGPRSPLWRHEKGRAIRAAFLLHKAPFV